MNRFAAARNLLKVWLFLAAICALLGLLGWIAGGYRLLSTVVFCTLFAAVAAYWYADRVVMGMVGAKELPLAEAPLVHSTLARLAAKARWSSRSCTSCATAIRVRSLPVAAARLGDRRLARPARRAAGKLEGVLAHELARAPAGRGHAGGGGLDRVRARRVHAHRRLPAGAHVRNRPARGGTRASSSFAAS